MFKNKIALLVQASQVTTVNQAVQENRIELVKLYLERGMHLQVQKNRHENWENPLVVAWKNGNLEMVRILVNEILSRGMDINTGAC